MITREKQAVVEAKKEDDLYLEMRAVIGDADAKYMGTAKSGGRWFKNHKTGTLYRVDKGGNGYEVKEIRKAEEDTVEADKKKVKTAGSTRQAIIEEAKAKKIVNFRVMNKAELTEAVKPGTTANRIKEIQETAVKRWKSGWKFQDNKKVENK